MRPVGFGVGAVLVAALLAGCSDSGPEIAEVASWPIGTSEWSPRQGADDAFLAGTLSLEDGCVYVVNGGVRTLPLFPRSLATWNEDSQTLTYAGTTFRMGDSISAGGGWMKPNGTATVPATCEPDAYGEVMFIEDEDIAP